MNFKKKGVKNEENFDNQKTTQQTRVRCNDGVLRHTPTGENNHGRANGKNRRTDGFELLSNGNNQPTAKKAPQPA